MIVVKPMSGQTKIKVTGLHQWDKLQTLQFEDAYPSGTEVHFAIKGETVALVYLLENGSVRIPSVLLQKALPIMAWVHVGETTVLEIEMPVTPRAMPSDYTGIEDDTQHSIEYRTAQLEQWQVEAIKQMSDRYTKAQTDKQLKLKADAERVYTKLEANTLLNEKADADTVYAGLADRYTKAEADVLLNDRYTKAEADVLLNDRYTKAEADVLLNEKASVTELTEGLDDRYTKTETDSLLAGKVDKTQPPWITPTLLNGATGTFRYRRNQLGRLETAGTIDTTASTGSLICTLTEGHRVAANVIVGLVSVTGVTSTLKFSPNGNVDYYGAKAVFPTDAISVVL